MNNFFKKMKGFIASKLTRGNNSYHYLFIAIIFGVICGLIIILFNYLLELFKFGFSYIPYFLAPIIAGLSTSLLVKYGKFKDNDFAN